MGNCAAFKLLEIPFQAAESGRSGPLSWGQEAMRQNILWMGSENHYFNLHARVPVPKNRSAEDVCSALARLVERHEALRSRYLDYYGSCSTQVVSQSGSFPLRVVECASESQVALLERSLAACSFDPMHDWPFRFALANKRGRASSVVAVLSHQALDGAAAYVCLQELTALLNAQALPAASLWHPLDQALSERGEAAGRDSQRALEQWADALERIDQPLLRARGTPASPRFWKLGLLSPAVSVCRARHARELGHGGASVIMGSFCALLRTLTGAEVLPLQLIVANRFRPHLRHSVSVLAQDGLVAIDAAGASLYELIAHTAQAGWHAYKASHYDPRLLSGERSAVAQKRGLEQVDVSYYVNDLSQLASAPANAAEPSFEEALALIPKHTETVLEAWPHMDSSLFLAHQLAPAGSLLTLMIDSALLPLARGRSFLRALEALIVRAAFQDVSAQETERIAAALLARGR